MLVVEAALGSPAGEALPTGLLAIAATDAWSGAHRTLHNIRSGTYIFLRLHSAQACGVVMRLAAQLPLGLLPSDESVDCFLGVTPWTATDQQPYRSKTRIRAYGQVWNIPPWVGIGIDGAMASAGLQQNQTADQRAKGGTRAGQGSPGSFQMN